MGANDELLAQSIAHAILLERFKGGLVAKLIRLLNASEADIVAKLIDRDPTAVSGAWSTKRLAALLEEIRIINRAAYNRIGKELTKELKALAEYEGEWQVNAINDAAPVKLNIVTPTAEQLWAAVVSRPFQGKLLSDVLAETEAARARQVRDAIRQGFVEGETISQMVSRIRGTRAMQYQDGILEISRRAAEGMVRTAVAHTANAARDALYKANADIVKGVMWLSVLDGRTSAPCRALSGRVFPVDSGPRPPRHWRCRSVVTPITRSFRELGLGVDEFPKTVQSSMNGTVPAELTYNDWLKTQPASFQDEVLGATRGKLFRSGGLSVETFVDAKFRSLTLAQLREKEAAAFKRAGL